MAVLNISVDDELEVRAYRALERLGVTPSEFVYQVLRYVAERRELPFPSVVMSEEEEDLVAIAKERLASPQRVTVQLDDL